ncbi:patellin-3-like [Cucurbita moschata]|uniref:Patellin-3-like n=1 Tax=Cucurbita moschata TaxID=3662 RepID=A0A6J1EBM8_CUCMO|nr:patellin-3-like [Cucurbita moschata]
MADQELLLTDVPLAEKADWKDLPLLPEPAEKEPFNAATLPQGDVATATEAEVLKSGDGVKLTADVDFFKEESTKVADLSDSEKKALEEFKQLIQEALNKFEFTSPPPSLPAKVEDTVSEAVVEKTEEPIDDALKLSNKEEPLKSEAKVSETNEDKGVENTEKSNETTPPAAEKVLVAVKTETAVDDDGAKTVEAIEETVVAVAVSATAPSEEGVDKNAANSEPTSAAPEEVSIWGIPLLADERSDVVLLKFLRARDFKVRESFAMIKNTIQWRKDFKIDELLEEDLGTDLEKVAFMHGSDKEGHPVCYNVYGEFQNRELYQKTFSDEEKRQKFLRWRIQFLEKSIRKLDFTPGGVCTIVHVNDLKNSPGLGKWELRQATKDAVQIFQDNYPEFVARQVFINVPWWYLAVNRMISPFMTQRSKSKFVLAGPSKSAETLLRYVTAQELPVKYGGMSKDGEFETCDSVTEITMKPSAKHTVEYPVTQGCVVTWEVRVVGWEVRYGTEFVPSQEGGGGGGYTVIIEKPRRVVAASDPVLSNTFKTSEAGKLVLSLHNPTSKKKKLLYRFKTKSL